MHLVRNSGGLPGYHLPRTVTFGVNVGELQFELVATHVKFPVAGYHCSISQVPDFPELQLQRIVDAFASLHGVYEAGFGV